jgi:hypothetical protein
MDLNALSFIFFFGFFQVSPSLSFRLATLSLKDTNGNSPHTRRLFW